MVSTTTMKRFEFRPELGLTSTVILIPEVLDPDYGMHVWPCAPVLAQYVWRNKHRMKDCNVLELGAGTALPGILAAKLGANVTLSDASHLSKCVANCKKACEANNVEKSVNVIGITWGQFSPDIVQHGPVDVILGSDCFYDSKDFEDILVTVAYLLEKNPGAQFWTTYQERSSDRTIFPLLEKWNLTSRVVPLDTFDAMGRTVAGSDLVGSHTIHMLIISSKRY